MAVNRSRFVVAALLVLIGFAPSPAPLCAQYEPSMSPPAGPASYSPSQYGDTRYGVPPTTVPQYGAAPDFSPPPQNFAAPPGNPAQPGGPVVKEVRIEGNHTTSTAKLPQLSTRVGQPFDPRTVLEDVRALAHSRKFLDVKSQSQVVPDGIVVIFKVAERPTLQDVEFVGNQGIRTQTLRKKSELAKGQPLDPYAVEEARRRVEAYYREQGYSHAQITIREGNKVEDRRAVFIVSEGPARRVLWTSFEGNKFEGDSRLRLQVKTKPGILWLMGGKVDNKKLTEDVDRLTAYYRGFGYFQARVQAIQDYNEEKSWLSLKFIVNEGPRFNVRNVSFLGNEKFKNDQLNKNLEQIAGKPFHQAALNRDLSAIRDVYGENGYVFADVQAEIRSDDEKPVIDLVYNISEGRRARMGLISINITGDNPHTQHSTILDRMSLRPGDIINTKKLREDERRLRFASIFNNDPTKGSTPKIALNKPDDDGEDRAIAGRGPGGGSGPPGRRPDGYRGQSPDSSDEIVEFSPSHTRDANGRDVVVFTAVEQRRSVAANTVQQARFQSPGYADSNWSGYNAPPSAGQSRAAWGIPSQGNAAPSYLPRSAQPLPASSATTGLPSTPYNTPYTPQATSPFVAAPYSNAGAPIPARNSNFQSPPATGTDPFASPYSQSPAPYTGTTQPVPAYSSPAPVYQPPQVAPGPVYGQPNGGQLVYGSSAPGQPANGGNGFGPPTVAPGAPVFATPGLQPFDIAPPPGDPLGPPDQIVPIDITAAETQTGRLMMGVGVNSDAGLVGNFVLDEQNFDILRLPRSWQDISDGRAWRGGGQRFRLEANPGTVVQRYAATYQIPYLNHTPVQFGVSGFYFTRIYQDWSEGRVGGKLNLGYAFTPDLTGRIAFSGERVDIYDPAEPTPPQLERALGENDRYGFSIGLAHDTRDSPFLPTQGHLVSADFEQVVGSFEYPRVIVEGRQYFLLRERADRSGRHVIGIGGVFGITGSETPIYDNFFAGGFSTLRGFSFRGASPLEGNVQVGGQFELLGSVEYLFPITADDALRGVVFCDLGTIDPKVQFDSDQFRAAPGFGLRISVPAMGPAPIALDVAFPIAHAVGDRIQNFSFNVGFAR